MMSGPGGSYNGKQFDTKAECTDIIFKTTLASPNPTVVDNLQVGDILIVRLDQSGARPSIVAEYKTDIVGAIIERVPDLARCLQEGHEFQATVLTISGGSVRVEVEPI